MNCVDHHHLRMVPCECCHPWRPSVSRCRAWFRYQHLCPMITKERCLSSQNLSQFLRRYKNERSNLENMGQIYKKFIRNVFVYLVHQSPRNRISPERFEPNNNQQWAFFLFLNQGVWAEAHNPSKLQYVILVWSSGQPVTQTRSDIMVRIFSIWAKDLWLWALFTAKANGNRVTRICVPVFQTASDILLLLA